MRPNSIERVAVCGLGKLGACIAGVIADCGYPVIATDLNPDTIAKVNAKQAPIAFEPGVNELYQTGNVKATKSYKELVKKSDACFFIVPTPSLKDGSFDNTQLFTAIRQVAKEVAALKKRNYIFVINSTVTPGSCDDEFIPMLNCVLGRLPYSVCYNPEFIALGNVVQGLQNPDIILIGGTDKEACLQLAQLYSRTTEKGRVHIMSLKEAELTKIALNCFITMKISFANQIGVIAEDLGVNAAKVLTAVGDDSRIGHRCLTAGLPYGGPCLPRDNKMLRSFASFSPLSAATDMVNEAVRARTYLAIIRATRGQRRIGILGMSYKPGAYITEESLGEYLQGRLRAEGYEVRTYDPIAPCSHSIEAVLDCPIIVIATASSEFELLTFPKDKVVIDPGKVNCHGAVDRSKN